MRFKNPVIDRIWLTLVAIAFLVMAPMWLILSVERMGWRFVTLTLCLALYYRWMQSK